MEKLHTDIVANILDRLPTETALRAKQVCKTWRILLRNKTDKVGLLFFETYNAYMNNNRIYYGEPPFGKINYNYSYDTLNQKMQALDKMNRIKHFQGRRYMVGSCNGLVCFQLRSFEKLEKPFLVCNPITAEIVYVPLTNRYTERGEPIDWSWNMISGFGYCHSTNEYKIVKMYYEDQRYHVQVYTVGDAKWRSKDFIYISGLDSPGIHANGALHWLGHNNIYQDVIIAFNLEDETFQFIPHFTDARYGHGNRTKLLGGKNLYLVDTSYDNLCTDIWAYKRTNTNTSSSSGMKENSNAIKMGWWIKEFSIDWEMSSENLACFDPLAITSNDEILFHYRYLHNPSDLYYYDLRTSTLNKLLNGVWGCYDINVIPHANSIVSLPMKGLEEV